MTRLAAESACNVQQRAECVMKHCATPHRRKNPNTSCMEQEWRVWNQEKTATVCIHIPSLMKNADDEDDVTVIELHHILLLLL